MWLFRNFSSLFVNCNLCRLILPESCNQLCSVDQNIVNYRPSLAVVPDDPFVTASCDDHFISKRHCFLLPIISIHLIVFFHCIDCFFPTSFPRAANSVSAWAFSAAQSELDLFH